MKVAIASITKHGTETGRRLADTIPNADLYYMSKFRRGDEEEKGITLFDGSVRLILPDLFQKYDGIVLIISLGAVVRMIAPILKDKKTDPAVVVLDDRAEHAISVLSGHIGGANELTHKVAALTGARPVITTASDVQKTIPVDMFGREFGWKFEYDKYLTQAAAAVVNEEPILVVQESGETNWWKHDRKMPDHIRTASSVEEAIRTPHNAALVVTHRLIAEEELSGLRYPVVYRPKSIVIGIGCNRGTGIAEIEAVVNETLESLSFSKNSVKAIASIDLKKDEQGILELSGQNNWPFVTYKAEELNKAPMKEKSDTVYQYTGAYGVSEPAAFLASNGGEVVLHKKKSGNVTISVAIFREEK
ncbi:cobalt-precorrin 5A hydrolase [Domibacillus epiphyticus]|uniref:Cobalamin biosynthesis protein CbiG n=1 Tax=Domibacillus epiphyticus TaxID=1714355 RepID=A0A1V2A6W1_9BACI|nr:cobalamin biosynthesis protein [Domibacillus epiphyticus]OMP66741.1 cobalamin biosynthesis protein CbiG [Domibacillus epiphyticus]